MASTILRLIIGVTLLAWPIVARGDQPQPTPSAPEQPDPEATPAPAPAEKSGGKGAAIRVDIVQLFAEGKGLSLLDAKRFSLGDEEIEAWVEELHKQIEREKKKPSPSQSRIERMEKLLLALDNPSPKAFPPGLLQQFTCFRQRALREPACDSKLEGYAYAAYRATNNDSCWHVLEDIRKSKGSDFRYGVQEWMEENQGKDMCVKPAKPARCQIGQCWGEDAQTGIAFRPAVEFGAAVGRHFGFDEASNLAFQISASIGVRAFFMSDLFDVRFGVGVASVPTANGDMDAPSRSGILVSPGLGLYRGLFGISFIWLFDPSETQDNGKGVGVSVDVAALKNLVH